MDAAAYLSQLQALLPPGYAWPREPDAVLTKLLSALAAGLADAEAHALGLVPEADPRTATLLLSEWEALVGLPDPCSGPAVGLEARRRLVVQRLTSRGGQNARYFRAVAAALGFPEAEVREFSPFTVASGCTDALTGGDWLHTWRFIVRADAGEVVFTAASGCTDPLRTWGSAALDCAVRRVAPAHTVVQIAYADDYDWMDAGTLDGEDEDWGELGDDAEFEDEDWGEL